MIVVDANVVVVFLLDSPLAPEARAVHAHDAAWITPPLCQCEVLNALVQETKARKLTLRDALDAAETAARLGTNRADGCDPSAILTTAHSSGLTAYDATYVVLARSLGVPLVTEDKQILRACPDVARSMRQFLSPPELPMTVREKQPEYQTARRGRKRAKA
jgi:predicted nucleic acid-binding protein